MITYSTKEFTEIFELFVANTQSGKIKWSGTGCIRTTKFDGYTVEFNHTFKDDYYDDWTFTINGSTLPIGGKKNKNRLFDAITESQHPKISLLEVLKNM